MGQTLAVIVGAGRGERMGGGTPKAFLELLGETLLARSARAFEEAPSVDAIVAVVPAERVAEAARALAGFRKVAAVVAGGATRQASVREGLRSAPAGFDGVVLVHDAARALVTAELVETVAAAARARRAAIPAVPVTDTLKRVEADGRVAETVPRETLFAAQTPQGFDYALLRRAAAEAETAGVAVTDEAMAVERLGLPVFVVPGSPENIKVTLPIDLERAAALLAARKP